MRRGNGGLYKLGEIPRVLDHGNVIHIELSLRFVLESFDRIGKKLDDAEILCGLRIIIEIVC